MSQLKSWDAAVEGASLLPQGRRTRSTNALLAANTRALSEIDPPPDAGQDARGQALRALRLQQHVDPVLLATKACISLRQLFQLETGASSLFYSEGLRNQAGRRVAAILGADWDQLHRAPAPTTGKYIRLVTPVNHEGQRTDVSAPPSALSHAPVAADIPGVLMKPASDTLVVSAEPTAQLTVHSTAPQSPGRRRSLLWSVVGIVLIALICGAAGLLPTTLWTVRW